MRTLGPSLTWQDPTDTQVKRIWTGGSLLWLLCATTVLAPHVGAERDIVFSARYYLRPGSQGFSSFQLYRINPDGTRRTRITFDGSDDRDPQWSPDGRSILFLRLLSDSAANISVRVCTVRATGGRIVELARLLEWPVSCQWSPDGRNVIVLSGTDESARLISVSSHRERLIHNIVEYVYSPDGTHVFVRHAHGADEIINCMGKRAVTVQNLVSRVVWIDNRTLAGLGTPDQSGGGAYLQFIGADGMERARLKLQPANADALRAISAGPRYFTTDPTQHGIIVWWDFEGTSTSHFYDFYRIDLRTGAMEQLTSGTFLSWSGDGRRYCLAPGRDLAPYDRRRDGHVRRVWVAPLLIGSLPKSNLTRITSGLVWVDRADWRRRGN